ADDDQLPPVPFRERSGSWAGQEGWVSTLRLKRNAVPKASPASSLGCPVRQAHFFAIPHDRRGRPRQIGPPFIDEMTFDWMTVVMHRVRLSFIKPFITFAFVGPDFWNAHLKGIEEINPVRRL